MRLFRTKGPGLAVLLRDILKRSGRAVERALRNLLQALPRVVLLRGHREEDTMAAQNPKRDPKTMFATAEQFWEANNILLETARQRNFPGLEMPGIALSAMTLELYLKCL